MVDSTGSGKGGDRRPRLVSREEYESNYDRAFGKDWCKCGSRRKDHSDGHTCTKFDLETNEDQIRFNEDLEKGEL